ncbi:DMSO/TMAO reductase YedYZ molybdopterin-dependent catalytic subunit [Streptomyces sp. V3I8]|uniref:sulfite oxidase n=1 Tax=Streptomyces sp. V3I8 TaxID=3042279 RepID=UPI002788469E|nr:sulfite oxidase [Streptomyces sp. V3I8]MDQ1035237.1 DMSO/TMAO reductase YedYZ molybdopterin-dependent catalytic subunit [Streptomyces sp. V3I8]
MPRNSARTSTYTGTHTGTHAGARDEESVHDRRRLRQWLAGEARADGVERRDMLRLLAAAGLATTATAATAGFAPPAPAAAGTAGRTERAAAPRDSSAAAVPGIVKPLPEAWFTSRGTNAETRFEALAGTGHHTPTDRFFVRNHTATPVLDANTWTLTVWGDGLVKGRTSEFTLDDLKRLPATTRSAFVECAGNGRSFFTTQQGQTVSGTAWTLGAVGVARWRGVRLAEVLRRAGLSRGAVDVLPRGLDADYVTADGTNLGRVRRPLPLSKALDDVLLAYEMNGEPLPPDHGHPVRVLVPSWVGIASIKWVGDIEVSAQPLYSPWNTDFYRLFGTAYPEGGSAPLTRQTLKSAFELPWNARLEAAADHRLTGRSWSGAGAIARVDVSTDGGVTWQPARLHDAPRRADWVRWSADWRPAAPGAYTLLARATDTTGRTQPQATVHNTQGYLFDAVVRHPVQAV